MNLSRRQRLLIFKLSALLSMVRWYNIFFIALAQYLAVVFVLTNPDIWWKTLKNIDLHFIVFASLFSISAGYLINCFYDAEKDLINRPQRTVHEKIMRQSTALRLYFLFNTIAVLMALSASLNVFIFFSAYIFALWFYSHKLKRITFLGNISAAILTIFPFFAIFIYYNLDSLVIFTYVSFVLLLIFLREILKDIISLKGDLVTGYNTIPATIGIGKTKALMLIFGFLGFIPVSLVYYARGLSGISIYLVSGMAALLFSLGLLITAKEKPHFEWLNHLYRFLIIFGIAGLILFSL